MGNSSSTYEPDVLNQTESLRKKTRQYQIDARETSNQSDILHQAELLRKKARQYQIDAQETSNQSQNEYLHGSKGQAKVLSEKKKIFYNKMNENNCQAAELIFNFYNKNLPMNEIDLHGLYVNEALEYLQKKIDQCHLNSISQLKVITGIGKHSQENIAKIKPKVQQFAHKNNIEIETYPGHLILHLNTKNSTTNLHRNNNENNCIIL